MTECKALLLTDVVDSTALSEQLGDKAMAEVWAAHDRAARDLLPRWRGREIGETDGMLLLFDTASEALQYALDYHQALRGLPVPLQARAGLHVGPVMLRQNSAEDVARGATSLEVEGIAKPVAARIMSVAAGGQTLLSSAARDALGELPQRVQSHGHWRMKGLAEPIELFEAGDDTSPWQPPPDSAKVYRVVRDGDLWKPLKEIRHNLPRERDMFVGRGSELMALARLVDEGASLVTLLGTGGSGKTRLARRFGWTWLGDFPGGVWFCDLSVARSLDELVSAVASTLDVPLGKSDPVVQLGHAIAGHDRSLIILDNFEQVTALAKATVGQWMDRAHDSVFLVTTRERLRLPGEQIFVVESLPEEPAIALFEARARAQDRHFALSETNRADVTAIVRALDGIPLAIELAAARIHLLAPKLLRERMRERFRILAGVRGPTERHATLLAAIDWSWNLLAPWEKSALAQCSAFEGGFTLAAAEAVLDLSAFPEAPPALDVVQALMDKSLVRAEDDRHDIDEPHFALYVSIREYAAEKLRTPGAFEGSGAGGELSAWTRHGRYYAGFGTDDAIDALHLHGGIDKGRRLALELSNLVVACRRAVTRGDGESAAAALRAAWAVFELQGPYGSAIELGQEVLASDGLSAAARACVLFCMGRACVGAGRMAEAREHYERALTIDCEVGNRRDEGIVLGSLGILHRQQGRIHEARECYERSLAAHREVSNRYGEGTVLANLGILHRQQGRIEEAREHYERALAIHREVGNPKGEGAVLGSLGILHSQQGRMEAAREHLERALAIAREVGDRQGEGITLGNLGILHSQQGRTEEAREHYARSLAIYREVGNRSGEGNVLGNLGDLHFAQGRLEEAREHFEGALAIFRELRDRRSEAVMLGEELGRVYAQAGASAKARASFAAGEQRLRELGSSFELGTLLCARGEMEADSGDLSAAYAALEEATKLAVDIGAGSESGLGRAVTKLREKIATKVGGRLAR